MTYTVNIPAEPAAVLPAASPASVPELMRGTAQMPAGTRAQAYRDWDHADPNDIARVVMADLAARMTNPNTIAAYQQAYRDLVAFMQVDSIESVLMEMVKRGPAETDFIVVNWKRWMAEERKPKLGGATIELRLSALRFLLEVANARRLINWRLTVKNPKVWRMQDVHGPTKEQVAAMIKAAGGWKQVEDTVTQDVTWQKPKAQTPIQLRDQAIIALLYSTGIRSAGLSTLSPEDYDRTHASGPILWVKWKGYDERVLVDVDVTAAGMIDEWLAVRGSGPGALFPSFGRYGKAFTAGKFGYLTRQELCLIVDKTARLAGINHHVCTHALRHSAGTQVAKDTNGDVFAVQKFLRHKSPTTSAIYVETAKGRNRRLSGGLMEGVK